MHIPYTPRVSPETRFLCAVNLSWPQVTVNYSMSVHLVVVQSKEKGTPSSRFKTLNFPNNIRDCWRVLTSIHYNCQLQLRTSWPESVITTNNPFRSFKTAGSILAWGEFLSLLYWFYVLKNLARYTRPTSFYVAKVAKRVIFRAKSLMKERHERAIQSQSLFWPNNNVKL